MEILQECSEKMDKAITSYKSTLGTIRTGTCESIYSLSE